jgi:hypothetical protein
LSGGTLLMVVKRVELQTLSESLLYGEVRPRFLFALALLKTLISSPPPTQPSIVTPSSDAELEWETIKVNSQQFVALWRLLLTKVQVSLLVCYYSSRLITYAFSFAESRPAAQGSRLPACYVATPQFVHSAAQPAQR